MTVVVVVVAAAAGERTVLTIQKVDDATVQLAVQPVGETSALLPLATLLTERPRKMIIYIIASAAPIQGLVYILTHSQIHDHALRKSLSLSLSISISISISFYLATN